MSLPVGRLGDPMTHGAVIITASSDETCDGIPVARIGDLVNCPLKGHGINPLVSPVVTTVTTDGLVTAHGGMIAQCGAIITTGSPTRSLG